MSKNLFYEQLQKESDIRLDTRPFNHTELVEKIVREARETEEECNCIREELKTCGRCIHEGESADIVGSSCYLCKRNPEDHRIDWFEEKKEIEEIKFTGAALTPDGTMEMEGIFK